MSSRLFLNTVLIFKTYRIAAPIGLCPVSSNWHGYRGCDYGGACELGDMGGVWYLPLFGYLWYLFSDGLITRPYHQQFLI